jgi:ATP-dependent DNA ligase
MVLLRDRRRGFIEPCLPTPAKGPPKGAGWIHEIKHDGFRLLARREAAGVRLITRHGNDFTSRFPLIAAAVAALPARSCLIDGEAIVCDEKGLAVFDLVRRQRTNAAAVHCAFDLLELDGGDFRQLPIETRKRTLASLLRGPIRVSPSISILRRMEPRSTSTLARSAARALSRSGSAGPTIPAEASIGSRSKTRRRPL